MFNLVQGIVYYLEKRSDIEIPHYNLELSTGNQGGAWLHETRKLIIPKWIFDVDRDPEYCVYYIAHEISHVCVGEEEKSEHGILFYHYFNLLCPPALIAWEAEYLPENEIYLNV